MPSSVVPTLRYADAPKAIAWLCDAFGFERRAVYEGDEPGVIDHAELAHGEGLVMLGSVRPSDYGDLVTTVADGGRPTAGIYVVVEDVDAHARRAREAGAEIVLEPRDEPYGARDYTCRDLEGNVWSFGDYDPWASE